MPTDSGIRGYTHNVIDNSTAAMNSAQERAASIVDDTRQRARSAVDGVRNVPGVLFTVSRRHTYVQLGATDAVVAVITKRSAELPGETTRKARQLGEITRDGITTTADLVTKAKDKVGSIAGDAKDRSSALVQSMRTSPVRARAGAVSRAGQVKDAYVKLGARGEQVAVDVRHDPVVVRMINGADTRVEQAANQLTSVAQKLRARAVTQAERETAAATSTPVRPIAARQVPAHRTTVRNTPAGEASISTTPIHRAAAYETETRKAAAAKAAETRHEHELEREQAAQARSDAAAKAAVTRKQNAEQAAAKRQAAAAKAAKTRKEKAAAREQATQARSGTAAKRASTRKQVAG